MIGFKMPSSHLLQTRRLTNLCSNKNLRQPPVKPAEISIFIGRELLLSPSLPTMSTYGRRAYETE
jgi:hypothetical protein